MLPRIGWGTKIFILFLFTVILCGNNSIAKTSDNKNLCIDPIKKVLSYEKMDGGVSLECITEYASDTLNLFLSFPVSDVARIEISYEKEINIKSEGQKYSVYDSGASIEIKTDSISVIVRKEPWQLEIFKQEENMFLQQFGIAVNRLENKIFVTAKLQPNEHFYGFGEKFNGLDQRGNRIVMELNDAYMSDDDSTYKSIPFFMSSKRYGLLVNSTQQIVFNMGNESETEYNFEMPGTSFEYFVFTNDDPLKIMSQYTEITGRPPLIPKWSLEPWISRRGMTGWNEPAVAEADIEMMINNGFRVGVVLWEGIRRMFDGRHGKEMNRLSNKWHSMGIKQVSWDYTGHIQKDSPLINSSPPGSFLQFKDSSFCLGHRSKKNLYLNPLNTEAMEWWKKNLYEKRFLSKDGLSVSDAWNLDGVKLDFSELFPKSDSALLGINKSTGMHNVHAVLFSEQIYNWLQTIKPEGGITWVRGGGLGLQKVGFSWGGDRGRTFEQLRGTVMASLAVSVCGVSFIGHDLGGYRGGDSIEERKVYIRGVQYATFSPGFHDHGSAPAPWEQNEYGRDNYSFYSRVRYNILPYLYNCVKISNETGIPMMRTLFMHHPEDHNTFAIEDEYYLGDNLLVAPVLTSSNIREVYLPEGEWIDFWTRKDFTGKQFINYETPLNRIPVFVKAGSIIPLELNDEMKFGGMFPFEQKNNLLLTFRVFAGESISLKLFRNDYISISKEEMDNLVTINLKNICENFGLILDGISCKEIFANGKILTKLNMQDFSLSEEGWRFDSATSRLYVKVKINNEQADYKIEIAQPEKHSLPLNDVVTYYPGQTEITNISGWNHSVDLFFAPVKEAEFYIIKYWQKNDDSSFQILTVPQPPATISNLENGKEYNFTVAAINGDEKGKESIVKSLVPGKRYSFFTMKTIGTFVNAEHCLSSTIESDSTRKQTYGLLSTDNQSCTVWLKMKTGFSHYLYYRWYEIGKIDLSKGENYFTLQLTREDINPGMLYFTSDHKNRPFLKNEIEADYEQRKVNITNEKTLVIPHSRR